VTNRGVDKRVIQQAEVIDPTDVAAVLGPEGESPAPAGAGGAGKPHKQVTEQRT
jgi:hypothetical protein